MAKAAAKKPAKKAAPKAKTATKPKTAAKPAKPKVDWPAVLRSGESGIKKWNNLTIRERGKIPLVGTDLTNTDLTAARLEIKNLCGVDFTGSLLNNGALFRAQFDEHTKWPVGFTPPEHLKWKGTGDDPRKAAAVAATPAAPAPTDFGEFLTRLKQVTDPGKLSKAAAMLRAEKFQLYAKVSADEVVGVVKSQTNEDLVYSCRLARDGTFGCGTQNLRQCGGLFGSPCKHLLVLIVGLAKAGTLDATAAHQWTHAARGKSPTFDKDALALTFLQYKGGEAGEVDWRPTETIPEDFYAM